MTKTTQRNLSVEVQHQVEDWLRRFPDDQKQSAVLGGLHAIQHEYSYLPVEQMDALADKLQMPAIAVYEVASFYSMFELEPVGKHTIAVCTNLSCMLRGGEEMLGYIENKLSIKCGQSTPDGKYFLKQEEECLAGCCGAPMMQVNHVYYENLTEAKVDEILDALD
ncbi:MAG: NADH-quinone oxidoreductase subunit NuoE [Gammaproteobacteria bacterium]|nr:NADH-quinone oxidoreductase subunit NuoE [Gammaproteobacteria bacterium]